MERWTRRGKEKEGREGRRGKGLKLAASLSKNSGRQVRSGKMTPRDPGFWLSVTSSCPGCSHQSHPWFWDFDCVLVVTPKLPL